MRMRYLAATAAAAAALAASVMSAAAASASSAAPVAATLMSAPGPQQFTTHFTQHPDTADSAWPGFTTGATLSSNGGPVWAFDNTTVKLVATPENLPNGDNWHVDVTTSGSFHGFADPTTGAAMQSDGSVKGQTSFDVKVNPGVVPDGSQLPSQQPLPTVDPSQPYDSWSQVVIPTGLSSAVLELFPAGSGATIDWSTSEASYLFSYQNGAFVQNQVAGQPYVQTGDVQGH